VGTKDQTIARLYGGDAAAWARFDPATVLAAHAPYPDTAGWFDDSNGAAGSPGPGGARGQGQRPPGQRAPGQRPPGNRQVERNGPGIGGRDGGGSQGDELTAARSLCTQATARGIKCTVQTQPGRHTWQFASTAFADALPWLADRLANPSAPAAVPPSSPPPAAQLVAAPTNGTPVG
jgi:S-formylglutathione hydrolase FrmB